MYKKNESIVDLFMINFNYLNYMITNRPHIDQKKFDIVKMALRLKLFDMGLTNCLFLLLTVANVYLFYIKRFSFFDKKF